MSTAFKYGTETFRPICIINNDKAEKPTEFDLCAVGGASRARLKSIIVATSGLATSGTWSPEIQEAVVKAFETGPGVFTEGVLAIRNLTAPAALMVKVGLIREIPAGLDGQSQVPVTSGFEFALLCGFWPILAYEVGLALARVSGQAEIDPRFFDWLSTSLGMPGTAAASRRRGTAARVGSKRRSGATAGKKARAASSSTPRT